MALLLPPRLSLLIKNPKTTLGASSLSPLSLSTKNPRKLTHSSFRLYSSLCGFEPDPIPPKPDSSPANIADEWGEKSEPEPHSETTKFSYSDPPKDEDEWGGDTGDKYIGSGNGSASAAGTTEVFEDKAAELKRCLVDTIYGTELGFRATAEVRAEVLELVNQLEAVNPTPAPVEDSELLDGNWVLLYTAFSELLPLLAAGTIPLVKVNKICQTIETSSSTIINSATLSSPFATFSFSASASFEVQTPTKIQIEFKEGVLQPPEIKSNLDLPDSIDIFGQKISLSSVQQPLNSLQEAVANLLRAISGQPPLRVPIPGGGNRSWLLITYLDKEFRISRGDGGLFVLAREGSDLLE
ncbi:Plastid lipid-associated protein/fibrillin conserved domain [Dillenia turbinata]|uniref:Plastid lipid-associated protein/fibrillin conserved domain n=1 Tax=Dillenia turbinata TaxID=194707 RepID=A0AAN8VIZ8_9MAGN